MKITSLFLLSLFSALVLLPAPQAMAETTIVLHDDESVTVHDDGSADAGDEEADDEECPAGFEESEDKCTPEEREEGCRDIRLDNGKGCVDR